MDSTTDVMRKLEALQLENEQLKQRAEEAEQKREEAEQKFKNFTNHIWSNVIIPELDTPSSLANTSRSGALNEIVAKLGKNNIFFSHRNSHDCQVPVELITNAFGIFQEQCSLGEPLLKSEQWSTLITKTSDFLKEMNKYYSSELNRVTMITKQLNELFTNESIWSDTQFPQIGKLNKQKMIVQPDLFSFPNDTLEMSTFPEYHYVPALIVEVRNELGTTNCNATVEVAANYAHCYNRNLSTIMDDFPPVSPSVLITISGTYFHVFGAVSSVVQQLNDQTTKINYRIAHYIDSLINPVDTSLQNDTILLRDMSVLLAALRNLILSIHNSPKQTTSIPYFETISQHYDNANDWSRISKKLVWFSEEKLKLWKFTKTYSSDAHKAAYDFKIAPKFYKEEKLVGDWTVVEMEFLKGTTLSNMGDDCDDEFWKHKKIFTQQIQIFHKSGWVHGDLREQNIIYHPTNGFRIVDFDWAGKKSENPLYPSNINTTIQWPEGVRPLQPITADHDIFWLKKMFSRFKKIK